jgi:hypothetical protein
MYKWIIKKSTADDGYSNKTDDDDNSIQFLFIYVQT